MNNKNDGQMKGQIIAELNKVKREGMQDLIEWLTGSDFFIAPCSGRYHNAFDGGLAEHSWNVLKLLREKNHRYALNLSAETIIICALLHDLCKVNFYVKHVRLSYLNNEPEYYYKIEEKALPCGHGEKSALLIQKFMKLSDQEIVMIRWHMGKYGDDFNMYHGPAFYKALELYPAALALHTADFEAATFLETHGVK